MDAARLLKNKHGATFVWLIVILAGLLAIAALVLDVGYRHFCRAKLQNAADAGSLAGAGRLKTHVFALYSIPLARDSAKYFADKNFEFDDANLSLHLDRNTDNDAGGDIVMGSWDPNATPKFTALPLAAYSSVNAVKVVARKTGETGPGVGNNSRLKLFLSKFVGFSSVGVKASAVSWRPPRARTYMLIGRSVCGSTLPTTISPALENMGWTDLALDTNNNVSSSQVSGLLFCPPSPPFVDVCGSSLFVNNGVIADIFHSVETDFYDPNYDAKMKTFAYDSHGNRYVATWDVVVPVAFDDPKNSNTAYPIWGYAELTLIRACGSGGANPCNAYGRKFSAPDPKFVPVAAQCSGNEIVIGKIKCTDCAHSRRLMGAKPVLAE